MTRARAFALLTTLVLALSAGPVLAQQAESPAGPFAVRELQHQTYQLSCIDVESGIEILGMLGYNTQVPSGQVELAQLPAVFALPFKAPGEVVGHSSYDEEKKPDMVALNEDTLSAPENRLMILYHGSQTEAVGRLLDVLRGTVDVPDRQVLIEGMIIELAEDDLKELGAQWEYFGRDMLKMTFLESGSNVPFVLSYDPEFAPSAALAERVRATIRMVIQEGKAEVLSSPSVLVLNNRNARIKVVRDTPIVSTKITRDVQNVDVKFEPVGIVLNIKPRVSEDDSSVTMQIIAEVSEVPEGQAIVIEGTEVAPAIDRRIVETVARVQDNTPFIIGGLIRNEKARTLDRIPILSRIPILGVLFRRSVTTRERREVIIVLTPRVIKTAGAHRPVLPKDTQRFDFLDNRLFRNSYRIKAEDVFDLGFLENNEDILAAFDRARLLVRRHPAYAEQSPFRELAARIIPGEDAVVIRMIYEILKKDALACHEGIPTDKLIVFVRNEGKPAGFGVNWLQREGKGLLEQASPDGTVEGYFGRPYPKDVLFLRFHADPSGGLEAAMAHPVAQVEWLRVDTADPDEAEAVIEQHLLELNKLGPDYDCAERALVLNTPSDLVRLKTAVALREVAQVNTFEEMLALRNFRVGRRFVLPEFDAGRERVYLIDPQVAEYFFKSDYYYPALQAKLERGYALLQQALAREDMP